MRTFSTIFSISVQFIKVQKAYTKVLEFCLVRKISTCDMKDLVLA